MSSVILCFFFSNGKDTLRCARKFPGETVSEDTSTGVNEFVLEKPGVVADKEDNFTSEAQAEDEQTQASLEFLNDIKVFSLPSA